MRTLSASIGGVFGIVAIALALCLEALIPGAIIHWLTDWTLLKSILVWVGAQIAIVLAFLVAAVAIAFATSK